MFVVVVWLVMVGVVFVYCVDWFYRLRDWYGCCVLVLVGDGCCWISLVFGVFWGVDFWLGVVNWDVLGLFIIVWSCWNGLRRILVGGYLVILLVVYFVYWRGIGVWVYLGCWYLLVCGIFWIGYVGV